MKLAALLAALALALIPALPAPAAPPERAALGKYRLDAGALEIDAELAALGKMLYFDRRLSGDGTMNCATCHIPGDDGSADGRELSLAYPTNGHFRNTPTTVNAALRPLLTWDGRASGVVAQALGPVGSPYEMNINLGLLVEKLRSVPKYREAFRQKFDGEATPERLALALGEFEKTLLAAPSPFDRWLDGDEKALDAEALAGMELFFGVAHCAGCHQGPNLGATRLESLGLEPNPKLRGDVRKAASLRYFAKTLGRDVPVGEEEDWGLGFVTGNPGDKGKFLVPSLRQLARTAPYGHDGRFRKLEDVVGFILAGGGAGPNKSDLLKPVELDGPGKKALVAFLLALTGEDPEIRPPRIPE